MSEFSATAIGVLVGLLVVVIITLIATSINRLESDEAGLEYDTVARELETSAKTEGLHSGPPGFRFIKFPTTFTNLERDTKCLSNDGLEITMTTSFQFLARTNQLYDIAKDFESFGVWAEVVGLISTAAISTACSEFTTPEFQSRRGQIQARTLQLLTERLDPIFCEVKDVQIQNIGRPLSYESVIQAKENARESITVALAERPIAVTNANQEKEQAQTASQAVLRTAESFSKITLEQANQTAAAIINAFETEAATYSNIILSQGLSAEGFLSYLAIRAIEDKEAVTVAVDEPAQFSYRDELLP